MLEEVSFEALAHYIRGMATMFFVIFAYITYGWRNRNRMASLLSMAVGYLALCYLKDIIFLFPFFSQNLFAENLSSLFDVACTPFICAFFLEVSRPGMFSNRDLGLLYLLFAATMLLYCVFPLSKVMLGTYILAAMVAFYTMVLVPFNVVSYNKILAENVSYTKNVSVIWVIAGAIIYFLWLAVYVLCFWDPTWLGEAGFDVFSIVAWCSICILSRNHRVVAEILHSESIPAAEQPEEPAEQEQELDQEGKSDLEKKQMAEEAKRQRDEFIAGALLRCMEDEKLYLNPLLSLNDLARAVGCNKTYVSTVVNSQGKTFYDYVNEYRISEACRIMETSNERLSMADVAIQSGFNSMSSFNRYFSKIKGLTPANYYRSLT